MVSDKTAGGWSLVRLWRWLQAEMSNRLHKSVINDVSTTERGQGFILDAFLSQVEIQSLFVAEVVGGAKTTAKKSSLKNLSHLWRQVSMKHTGSIMPYFTWLV